MRHVWRGSATPHHSTITTSPSLAAREHKSSWRKREREEEREGEIEERERSGVKEEERERRGMKEEGSERGGE